MLLKELLGGEEKKQESGYEKKIQKYFQIKRKGGAKQIKRFELESVEEFQQEWESYFKQLTARKGETESTDFNADHQAFLNNLWNYLSRSSTFLGLKEVSSIVSAVNNFCSLSPTYSKEGLLAFQRIIYEKLIESK